MSYKNVTAFFNVSACVIYRAPNHVAYAYNPDSIAFHNNADAPNAAPDVWGPLSEMLLSAET